MAKLMCSTCFSPFEGAGRAARVSGSALVLLGLVAGPALGEANWEAGLTTSADVTYTDNVFLDETDTTSDVILSADLTAMAQGLTPRTQVYFSYTFSFDAYVDTDDLNGTRHNLTANAQHQFIPGFLYVDASARIADQDTTPSFQSPATDRTFSTNKTRVYNGVIQPMIDTDLGSWSHLNLATSWGFTIYGDTDTSRTTQRDDDQIWTGNFSLRNQDNGNRLGWQLYGNARGDDDDFRTYEGGGLLSMQIGTNFNLLVRGGYDRTEGRSSGFDIDERYWRSGFEWNPFRDGYIRVEAGERFGGANYDGEIRYEPSKLINLQASYREAVQTDQGRFLSGLYTLQFDANGVPILVPTVGAELRDATTISKTARVALSGEVGRTSYTLSGYQLRREFDQYVAPGVVDKDETNGIDLSLGRRFGSRTTVELTGGWRESDTTVSTTSVDGYHGSLRASYQVGRSAQINASYHYQHRENRFGEEADENVFVLSISQRW